MLPREESDSWYSRGYFPHFDSETATQHVCFHLFDSLPQSLLRQWREELRHSLIAREIQEDEMQRELRKRMHDALDAGYGSCFLRDDRLAKIVEDALLHFDGARYSLHSWCVMPNHVHTLFTPTGGFKMNEIVHSWKSFTAHEGNKVLGRSGRFWEREPFDRYIRNQSHFLNTVKYIENNPVKAGLCELPGNWRWSSARRQQDQMQQAAGVRT